VTWEEEAENPVILLVRENPVNAVEEAGLRPMSPVILEVGTVETPDFAKII